MAEAILFVHHANTQGQRPDVDDEDNNTGYMSRQGTAFFISGVYTIMAVTANFSGGLFDVELAKAPKVTALSLSKIDITDN